MFHKLDKIWLANAGLSLSCAFPGHAVSGGSGGTQLSRHLLDKIDTLWTVVFWEKELAEYLLLLDANETLYNKYFWWKDYYYVEAGPEQIVKRGFCDLCKKLQFDDGKTKMYNELPSHWIPENQCKNPKMYT